LREKLLHFFLLHHLSLEENLKYEASSHRSTTKLKYGAKSCLYYKINGVVEKWQLGKRQEKQQ